MAVALLGIKETAPGERRVALTPETARKLGALGITVWYEAGAVSLLPSNATAMQVPADR